MSNPPYKAMSSAYTLPGDHVVVHQNL